MTRNALPHGRPMADDMRLDRFWKAELDDFEHFRGEVRDGTYADWRPAAWQAAGRAAEEVFRRCGAAHPRTATELGCGAAGVLLQLAARDVVAMGVDRSPAALELAARTTSTMHPRRDPSWCLDDFLRPGFAEIVPPADLVASAGVLERYSAAGQAQVLAVHAALSNRWVLLLTANLDSPLLRSYLSWAERHGRAHCGRPTRVDVPLLVSAAGHRIVASGGIGMFLDRSIWYSTADPAVDLACARLRDLLVAEGGPRFGVFPRVELRAADLPVLDRVENALSEEERLRFGVRHYYLVEVGHRVDLL